MQASNEFSSLTMQSDSLQSFSQSVAKPRETGNAANRLLLFTGIAVLAVFAVAVAYCLANPTVADLETLRNGVMFMQ